MFKPVIFTLFSLLVLLLLFAFHFRPIFPENSSKPQKKIHVIKHSQISESICDGAMYPALCISTVAALPNLRQKTLSEVISFTINATMAEVRTASSNCSKIRRKLRKVPKLQLRALDDCLELFSVTISQLRMILSDLSRSKNSETAYSDDLLTLLSGAMTNQRTCLDGFADKGNYTRRLIEESLGPITHQFSNALLMVKKMKTPKKNKCGREAVEVAEGDGFPAWLKRSDRELLLEDGKGTAADVVVAQDGSGIYTTIGEALRAAPNNSKSRFVIYIKTGSYYEYVEVESSKMNIMFLGEGIGKTMIRGNRSMASNWTTWRSATVAVVGIGFIAKGITIENYAGAGTGQAVALRCGSDLSAFYRCSFVGFQDTLYVHSLRQFYRECQIYGTVDFIFGNAAVVIQNSHLYARRPFAKQRNVLTAQGREDPNQNTGISIINCKVAAADDLVPFLNQTTTFLGRPWKNYSRTVFMYTRMAKLVDPRGWLAWDGDFALKTLYYGEYMNSGPGSKTSGRVKWPGYRVLDNSTEASQFTVANFVHGGEWLPATGVPFYSNLTAR